MKVVLASYGSRGDVEPCAAVGRELLRRGHDVCMAVPPDMLGFVESAGLAAVSYGPDSREQMNPAADFVRDFSTKIRNPISMFSEVVERVSRVKTAKTTTLKSLAEGADLLVAGFNERGLATNIAEYYGIPLAVVHFFPERVWSSEGLYASVAKDTDDAQRRALGLSEPPGPSALPVLEIQAYDELCLPGVVAEWVEPDARQPLVGALTLELPTDADDEVLSWIAAGTPPIYFGFGSTPVLPFADTVAMISAACTQLGERALICSGPNDSAPIPDLDHVRIVSAVNHAAIFPVCRAVVHHGGAGTTAAALRAGTPTLILWLWLDQPVWAAGVKELKVGASQQFSATNQQSLVADLRSILTPQCAARAGEVAAQMTTPAESVASAADLLEEAARLGSSG
ncbi:glycosyltransferase [Mycobacterium sp.]|uniref:glycosyltransferase n=1 Tax=Mycobacterium sp. TaxID=1785 RepID=UPI003F99B8BA